MHAEAPGCGLTVPGKQLRQTEVRRGNLNPKYGDKFEFSTFSDHLSSGVPAESARLELEVWDENAVSDDMMGAVSLEMGPAHSWGRQTFGCRRCPPV